MPKKLSEEEVIEINDLLKDEIHPEVIAEAFEYIVTPREIYNIKHGWAWWRVTGREKRIPLREQRWN